MHVNRRSRHAASVRNNLNHHHHLMTNVMYVLKLSQHFKISGLEQLNIVTNRQVHLHLTHQEASPAEIATLQTTEIVMMHFLTVIVIKPTRDIATTTARDTVKTAAIASHIKVIDLCHGADLVDALMLIES